MVSLFRPEVIEGRQQAWLGSIQLVRPVSLALLTLFVLAAAALVCVFLMEGRYTRKAHVTGYLVPDRGVLRLVPPQVGLVVQSHVTEGQAVQQGDVLFVLSVDRSTMGGDTQATVLQSLSARRLSLQEAARRAARLRDEQVQALDRQLEHMRRELAQMDAEAEVYRQQLSLKEQELAQYESLKDSNFVSPAHLRAKKAEMLESRAKLQGLGVRRATSLRDMAAVESRRRELPLQTMGSLGEIERELASLDEAAAENEARRQVVIRAPESGVVTAVLAERGHAVSPNTALASLLPADATLQAQLFAPSKAMGFLRPGQQVQLRYQAFPYQTFGHYTGTVLKVSRTPLQASELAGLPLPESLKEAPVAEPLYRITVALEQQAVQAYGHAQPLVAGMQLEADVMLERRRLIEWIFEPLLSIAGRV
jgi:membrane fusion protein